MLLWIRRTTAANVMGSHRHQIVVTNQTRNTVVCMQATIADTSMTRLFGLLGRSALASSEGLFIRPSSGVHTWGMRFAIDIMALDCADRVLGLWQAVGPWRVRGMSLRTGSILELAPGAIDRSATMVGDQLRMEVRNIAD